MAAVVGAAGHRLLTDDTVLPRDWPEPLLVQAFVEMDRPEVHRLYNAGGQLFGWNVRRFDDDASAMQALLSGQVDAIGCSTTVAAQIAKRAPANAFENKFLLRQQVMGVAMRPGQDELLKTVDDFVARNTANGELNKLYQKWLQTDLPKLL